MLSLLDNIKAKGISHCFSFSEQLNSKEKHWSRDKNIKNVLIHKVMNLIDKFSDDELFTNRYYN